jgi:hypothetical protein
MNMNNEEINREEQNEELKQSPETTEISANSESNESPQTEEAMPAAEEIPEPVAALGEEVVTSEAPETGGDLVQTEGSDSSEEASAGTAGNEPAPEVTVVEEVAEVTAETSVGTAGNESAPEVAVVEEVAEVAAETSAGTAGNESAPEVAVVEDVAEVAGETSAGTAGNEPAPEVTVVEEVAELAVETSAGTAGNEPAPDVTVVEEVAEVAAETSAGTAGNEKAENTAVDEEIEEEQDDEHTPDDELEELVAYDELSREELTEKLRACVENAAAAESRNRVVKIREAYRHVKNEEIRQKKEKYLENGGLEEDFENPYDAIDEEFKALQDRYRNERAKIREEREKELSTNLRIREGLIEELKKLVEEPASNNKELFEKLKGIDSNWRAVGRVPQLQMDEVYKTYQFHR